MAAHAEQQWKPLVQIHSDLARQAIPGYILILVESPIEPNSNIILYYLLSNTECEKPWIS